MKRKLLSLVITGGLIVSLISAAGAVNLYVDNEPLQTDVPAQIINDRTMVPIGPIFNALEADVVWDDATKTATGVKDGTTVVIQIDNTTAYVNNQPITLDTPAMIVDNRTMVPVAFVSQALGCDVTWDASSQTVGIAYALKGKSIYVTETGKKYHYDNSCNGGTYYASTLAEAMGRGLTPCEKCVTTAPETPVAGTSVTLSGIMYFDKSRSVFQDGSLGFGSDDIMFFDAGGEMYISDLTMVRFLADILGEENVNDDHTVITSNPNHQLVQYPNLSWEYEGDNIVFSYKGITFSYDERATGPENTIILLNGCRAINRMGGWLFNANDLAQYFGANISISHVGDSVLITQK